MNWLNRFHVGDATQLLRKMAADGVQVDCVVTSPPFYGLRKYGESAKEIGHEKTVEGFIQRLANTFDAVWDVLAPRGTLWIEMGDAHFSSGGSGYQGKHGARYNRRHTQRNLLANSARRAGLKPKNLMGQPWRLAFELQQRGWILRQEIIWEKPDCMPESAKDRPTTSHTHIFLFVKQRYYHYDGAAIAEPTSPNTHLRVSQEVARQLGSQRANGGTRPDRPMKAMMPGVREAPGQPKTRPKHSTVSGWDNGPGAHRAKEFARAERGHKFGTKFGREKGWRDREQQGKARPGGIADSIAGPLFELRNSRSVWRIPTEKFPGKHFATFPREIPRRAIKAGCPVGGTVLDIFAGSGTTCSVACELGCNFIGLELYEENVKTAYQYRSFQIGIPMPVQQGRAL